MTSRQIILARFETLMNGVTTPNKFEHVEINRTTPIDIRKMPFPMAFIYGGSSVRGTEEYGQDHRLWDVTLEVWAKETDMETLLPIIHAVIWDDFMTAEEDPIAGSLEDLLNGLVIADLDIYHIDPAKNLNGLSILYQVNHSPDKGAL